MIASAWPAFGQGAPASTAASALTPRDAAAALTPTEQERFMEKAGITTVRRVSKGIAGTRRATLLSGTITHDVSIQTIDQSKNSFQSAKGIELGFRDYWGFNVAAYRVALMVGLDRIPVSIARRYRSEAAAFTWWVDDVILDEEARVKQKQQPPDPARWTAQMHILRVFDELIANTDRNQGNMLIDRHWKIWLIDHTRAFRNTETLRAPSTIVRCERSLLEGMKALSAATMRPRLDDYLTRTQMAAILKRRDLLVHRIESLGPGAVYDLDPP